MIKSRARKLQAPMAHQKKSLAHAKTTPIVFDMSDPGTGKTGVGAWAFAERRRKRGKCLLVLAPRSLLRSAWLADFMKFAPDMKVSVATAVNREAAFEVDADVYVTNHDAAKWLAARKPMLYSKFDSIYFDESTAFKHHTSQRSRSVQKLVKMKIAKTPIFKYRRAMSATPTSNTVCDIWHQVYLLDEGKRLGPSFYAFRNAVCEPTQVGRNRNAIQWTDKEGAEEAVFALIADIVVRHRFEDCVDIPKTHIYTVDYELSEKQRKIYENMREAQLLVLLGDIKTQVTNKLKNAQPKVTAVNAAAVMTKLLQICSGAVYDNDKKYHVVETDRYEMLADMAEVRKQPLIFYFWRHQLEAMLAETKKRGMNFCALTGDTSDRDRDLMVQAYQNGKYDGMLAHPKNAAHGLTLTKGTSTIWPGPTPDLEWFKQGSQRQARIGQTEKTEVITVVAKGTVEERVYNEILMPKDGRMKSLLDLFVEL